jgi:hypothetical protein
MEDKKEGQKKANIHATHKNKKKANILATHKNQKS